MELPKINRDGGKMLDGIKSKLGFSNKQESYDDDYYYDDEQDFDDDYDDYDDFSDGGYRDNTRSSRSGYQPSNRDFYDDDYYAPRSSNSTVRSVSSNLVNIDDVRSYSRLADTSSSSRGSYGDTASSLNRNRESISYRNSYSESNEPVYQPLPNAQTSATGSSRLDFDSYDAFSSSSPVGSTNTSLRSLSIMRPASYGEVEQIARYLRAGDVVILCLKNTSSDLAKRVLDFSFGAASMVDARVECVGDKVFALSVGAALSDDEKARLISQGVL